MDKEYVCRKCGKELTALAAYLYRGAISCDEHFDTVVADRDYQRNEVMAEEHSKTATLAGLDFGDNAIGQANREILAPAIEIAGKEGARLKEYEGRN